ncbi:MAG TPA: serine/threonine-protein kinase [Pyrinomonadaceae bacterium]|nr:serine/threonine-protein kinase [Pyrinomonadaceae bacterium]
METERAERVAELVESALEREPSEWGAFLTESCGGDQALRAEVESLLRHQERARDFIEAPAFQMAAELFDDSDGELQPGQMLDGYEIHKLLGEGGMGEVYLARDVELGREVAVKLVKRGLGTSDVLRRFRHEEQILASLNHPHVARLFGGGRTKEGLPYFVMEYIEGLPIDKFCDSRQLPTAARLQLFRQVCAAVSYAHRHLVVHRDIKPSNILVTPAGEPKLLDFGIAKLLDPLRAQEATPRTVTMLGVMTPEYASPEQVRGEPVTTAADIYSLGVLLYELLTGHRPYHLHSRRPDEIVRVICEQQPERPSTAISRREEVPGEGGAPAKLITPESVGRTRNEQPAQLRRRLAGDLDNIVLLALRKEPARRYATVEQFSDDIRCYLEGLPVFARKATFGYRAAKFIARHKVGVASAALVVLAIIAGLTATIWQARVARNERVRAERRFNDVRKLANSNLFELHDAIANLPGSTPARELLVKRALEYLDSLAQESQGDASLQRELVAAYLKVGNVQGNPNNANLGDTAGALESYRKALAIAARLTASDPSDAQTRRFVGVISEKMSDAQAATGDTAGAVESQRRSLSIFKAIADAAPANAEAQQSLAISYVKLGDVLGNRNFNNSGEEAGAMQSYRSAAAILETLYAADPANPKTRRLLGLIYERLGTMLEAAGKADEALETYRKSRAIREPLAADFPTDTDAIRDAAIAHEKIGDALAAKGELAEALESRRKSLKIFQSLVDADPQNVQARQSLAISYLHLGEVLGNPGAPNLGRPAEALKYYRLAWEILKADNDPAATANVKTRETLEVIRQRMEALGARP